MRALQRLVQSADCVGEALVPFILGRSYLSQTYSKTEMVSAHSSLQHSSCIQTEINLGEGIDYSQQRGENAADVIYKKRSKSWKDMVVRGCFHKY